MSRTEYEGADESRFWEVGWEGHACAQQRRMAALPLSAKIDWLEQAHRVVRHMQESRRRRAVDHIVDGNFTGRGNHG